MKVNDWRFMKVQAPMQKKIDPQAAIKEKIKAKFGDKFQEKKSPKEKVELSNSAVKNSSEEDFGDVKSNDPNSSVTKDKLKDILRTGAFQFNPKERETLAKILK